MTAIEKDQLKELNERFANMEKTVSEIKDALLGNEFNEKAAYKTRIEVLEEFKSKVELKILKAQVWGTTIGFLLCAVLELIYKYSAIWTNIKK